MASLRPLSSSPWWLEFTRSSRELSNVVSRKIQGNCMFPLSQCGEHHLKASQKSEHK